MKKISIILFFILAMCSFAVAQSPPADFNKVRQIKLLESTREDVKRILTGFESDIDEEGLKKNGQIYSETFSTKSVSIEVSYSSGTCSDNSNKWNVPKGKVTFIEISLGNYVRVKDSEFDFSNFRKEQQYVDIEDLFIYHDRSLGIAFDVNKNRIETIYLFPTNSYYSWLCENKEAQEFREFYSTNSWFRNKKLEDRFGAFWCGFSDVVGLSLSANEVSRGCDNSAKGKNCSKNEMKISVATTAIDPEGIVLTYIYTVSGGIVVGEGANVVWDLQGVKPGTYTITAGLDSGGGVFGRVQTETVIVK